MDFRGSAGKTRSAGRAFPAEKGGRHDGLPPETVPPPGTGCRRCCPGCCCRRWVILQHGDGGQGPPAQTHHAHQAVVGGVHAVRREQHRRAAVQQFLGATSFRISLTYWGGRQPLSSSWTVSGSSMGCWQQAAVIVEQDHGVVHDAGGLGHDVVQVGAGENAAQGAHQAADCTTAPSAARTGPAYWRPGTGGRSPAPEQAVHGVGQKKFRKILVIPLICGPTACKITVKDLRL